MISYTKIKIPFYDFLILKNIDSIAGYARRNSLEPEIRRRTASLSTPHRASDIQVDPERSAALFRDARGVSTFIL